MALTLSCRCGTTFEVDDTFAGQTVSCPECHAPLRAPALSRGPLRTSGLAIASLVLALLGAFTIIGTVAAVICGLLALVGIARSKERIAGVGYALFGVVLGVLFTGLSLFAYSTGELFGGVGGQLRQQLMKGKVDYSGPLEIVRAAQGYKIARPSEHWGVARAEFARDLNDNADLMLVDLARDAYVEVTVLPGAGRNVAELQQQLLDNFKNQNENGGMGGNNNGLHTVKDFKLREQRRLPDQDGVEVAEVTLDVRVLNQPLTFLIHIVRDPVHHRAYEVRAWTGRRRYAQIESELHRVLDSFHVLEKPNPW